MQTSKFLASLNRRCYKEEGWFIPLGQALNDVSEEGFDFKPDERVHSIRELVNHLIFWNERWLSRMKGKEPGEFTEKNELTFEGTTKGQSKDQLIKRLLDNFDEWDKELSLCTEDKMNSLLFEGTDYSAKLSDFISSMILHNAYHLGQIMTVKKYF